MGHNSISIKKQDLVNQKTTAGIRKVTFAHKASAGQTAIDLTAMTTPPEFLSAGFVQATAVEIASAQLLFFHKNFLLISSARGVLQEYLTYTIASNTSIVFQPGFTTLEGEIFVGIIDGVTRAGYIGVDAVPIIATGVVAANSAAPFNVGKAFRGNFNPTQQVGDVIVYVDGQAQLRNAGNALAAPGSDGNYQELVLADGSAIQVQLNTVEPVDRSVLVVSSGLSILRPDGSIIQELQNVKGQLDQVIAVLSAVSGQPTSYFQAAPNNVDLMAFGNTVGSLDALAARINVSNNWAVAQQLPGLSVVLGGVNTVLSHDANGTWLFGSGINNQLNVETTGGTGSATNITRFGRAYGATSIQVNLNATATIDVGVGGGMVLIVDNINAGCALVLCSYSNQCKIVAQTAPSIFNEGNLAGKIGLTYAHSTHFMSINNQYNVAPNYESFSIIVLGSQL
jgi:hypothetical protein